MTTMSKYMAVAVFIAAVSVLALCNRSKPGKGDDTPKEGIVKLLGVITRRDSTRFIDICLREIKKGVRYDSATKRDVIVIDTAVAIPIIVPLMDKDGKAILDSLGKPKANPVPQYIYYSKDSVSFDISYISVDSLLRKR